MLLNHQNSDGEKEKPPKFFEKIFPNLAPTQTLPQNFWKLDRHDLINIFLMTAMIVISWISSFSLSNFYSVISYWDGPNYIYASMCLYNVPPDNLWTIYFKYPPSYFACHLPGFPLAIRLASTLFLNNFALGAHAAILIISCLLTYVFRRLLIIYNCSNDPAFVSTLLTIFPLRLSIYHTVGASEPLFLLFVCLAFIFFKTNQMVPLCLSISGACITRIEGLAIFGTIGLCYLFRFDILRAISVSTCILAPASLLLLHHLKFNDYLAYLHFNQGHQGLIKFPPFHEIFGQFKGGASNIVYLNSTLSLYIPFFIGTVLLYFVSVPFAIFSTVYTIYVSLLFHLDIFRYAIPGYVFALFVGFDPIISSPAFKRAMIYFVPFFVPFLLYHTSNQIRSNAAPSWFTQQVLNSKVSYF
ncbi:hypothetical protein TRFO_34986 [Tritrichomonas foetus]|uniref:Glycosyltransferase RgtA/B/C/D-like domain-containing protein n=1 Tax=Tritrichomonas foetus TaxID=1144522 RepID=A0A1J4JHK1_9EUKA|nr:hypothetical protein TRFO_34986 [Tritrichomonas foetus]|eukprot:OHS98614.1 hypothetical protein TRFO_34986 [Tritrichomonas foetus]